MILFITRLCWVW